MKKLEWDVIKKVIIGSIVGIVIIMSCLFIRQRQVIKDLEHDLTIKQETHIQEFDYTETEAYAKTIKETLAEQGELVVLRGEINIKHKYVLDEEGFLGINQTEKFTATANAYYQFTTDLNSATVQADGKKIVVTLKAPKLDKEATHRKANTMYVIQDETSSSLFSGRENSKKVVRFWEDTFDQRANERIEGIYDSKSLEDETVRLVSNLLKHLMKDMKIEVKMEV